MDVNNKKINFLINKINKILNKLNILILILCVYFLYLIINKLNILILFLNILKVITPLFIGIVIAWLLDPIVKILNKRIKKIFCIIIIYLFILFFMYLIMINIFPIFITQLDKFIKIFPEIIDKFLYKFQFKSIDNEIIKQEILNYLNIYFNKLGKDIPTTCVNMVKGFSTIILGFIIAFYFLINENSINLKKYFKKNTYNLILKSNNILRNYVKGTIFTSLIVFLLSTIVFYILKLDGALLLGFICGITNIIPYIGPYIGAILPILVSFTKNTTFGIIVIVIILIIQTIEGNIIQPLIMSKSIKIHPITTITGLLVFGYFFGIIGMIISSPLIAIFKEIFINLYRKNKKNI